MQSPHWWRQRSYSYLHGKRPRLSRLHLQPRKNTSRLRAQKCTSLSMKTTSITVKTSTMPYTTVPKERELLCDNSSVHFSPVREMVYKTLIAIKLWKFLLLFCRPPRRKSPDSNLLQLRRHSFICGANVRTIQVTFICMAAFCRPKKQNLACSTALAWPQFIHISAVGAVPRDYTPETENIWRSDGMVRIDKRPGATFLQKPLPVYIRHAFKRRRNNILFSAFLPVLPSPVTSKPSRFDLHMR